MSKESTRGEELATATDVTRAELLEAIETANDELADGLEKANRSYSAGSLRPSTHMAFKHMEQAMAAIGPVDPTRNTDAEDDE
ncbi:hypothetical protein [Halomontanus rarus]|uniref:hypothetical protein n=1 Tax=Halomontanus rarus TaxID=3034020 RepID=UPI00307C500F